MSRRRSRPRSSHTGAVVRGLGRGEAEVRLRVVRPGSSAWSTSAALRRLLRAGRGALRHAARRLRAGDEDRRGPRRLRPAEGAELTPMREAAASRRRPASPRDFPRPRRSERARRRDRTPLRYDDSAWRSTRRRIRSRRARHDRHPDPTGTTRTRLDGLFAVMHETGHGLYEHGVDPALERTLLARGASLGPHESQSRLWENLVGRSRPFWRWFYPRLARSSRRSWRTWTRSAGSARSTTCRPSLDPRRSRRGDVQPPHHPALRARAGDHGGTLDSRDLPDAWNAAMKEYLGLDVPDDARGVLQDMHWSRASSATSRPTRSAT